MNKYFNPNGCEIQDESLVGAKPTGFVDFNKPKYGWDANVYDLMNANTWFPSEVNTASEKKAFSRLTANEQEIYKYTFAQLSFNDGIQEEHLLDFRRMATNSLVKSTLTLQAFQEVNHSKSYAVLLDACGNSEEVFNLYKSDDRLLQKNLAIAEQFSKYLTLSKNTSDNMYLSAIANLVLEGIYFLAGFSYIFILGDKVQGARDMVTLIARDELNTHLPLFGNITKTLVKENNISTKITDLAYSIVDEAVQIELDYALYLNSKFPIMGISEELITDTVKNFANNRLKLIGLDLLYPKAPETFLQKLIKQNVSDMNSVKTNFFEGNVKVYSKTSISMDF